MYSRPVTFMFTTLLHWFACEHLKNCGITMYDVVLLSVKTSPKSFVERTVYTDHSRASSSSTDTPPAARPAHTSNRIAQFTRSGVDTQCTAHSDTADTYTGLDVTCSGSTILLACSCSS